MVGTGNKKIKVKSILDYANKQLARTDEYANESFKAGIIAMIEKVLMDSGNYEGFSFLYNEDSAFGTPGYFNRQYH